MFAIHELVNLCRFFLGLTVSKFWVYVLAKKQTLYSFRSVLQSHQVNILLNIKYNESELMSCLIKYDSMLMHDS